MTSELEDAIAREDFDAVSRIRTKALAAAIRGTALKMRELQLPFVLQALSAYRPDLSTEDRNELAEKVVGKLIGGAFASRSSQGLTEDVMAIIDGYKP